MTNVLTEGAKKKKKKKKFEEFHATFGKEDGEDCEPDGLRVTFFHACY